MCLFDISVFPILIKSPDDILIYLSILWGWGDFIFLFNVAINNLLWLKKWFFLEVILILELQGDKLLLFDMYEKFILLLFVVELSWSFFNLFIFILFDFNLAKSNFIVYFFETHISLFLGVFNGDFIIFILFVKLLFADKKLMFIFILILLLLSKFIKYFFVIFELFVFIELFFFTSLYKDCFIPLLL